MVTTYISEYSLISTDCTPLFCTPHSISAVRSTISVYPVISIVVAYNLFAIIKVSQKIYYKEYSLFYLSIDTIIILYFSGSLLYHLFLSTV